MSVRGDVRQGILCRNNEGAKVKISEKNKH